MAGSRGKRLVLQDRDRRLLAELGIMRIADREAAKLVAGFGSTTRANARLLGLTRSGLLRRFFIGTIGAGRKAVYTLSPRGADLVAARLGGIKRPSGRVVVGDRFVEHQAGINEIYLALKYRPVPGASTRLVRWVTFSRSISDAVKLTPDGYFEIASGDAVRPAFLEVDLGTEALTVWQQKTAYYLQLAVSGEFQKLFRQPRFRVLVVASSDARVRNLRASIARQTDKIFWLTTLDSINRHGLWSPIWLRPKSDEPQTLL